MPEVYHHGHFVVIRSYAKPKGWDHGQGKVNIALIELRDPLKPVRKFNQSLKAVRQVVMFELGLVTHSDKRHKKFVTIWNHYVRLAQEWEACWPLHFLHREWPLPSYLPDHRINQMEG